MKTLSTNEISNDLPIPENNNDAMNQSNADNIFNDNNFFENQNISFVERNQICKYSFNLVEKLDDLINKSQFDQVDNFFKDFRHLSLFLNYFAGFLSFQDVKNPPEQDILINVLSYLLFRNLDSLQSFIPLAINLLVGGPKKLFKPTKTQKMISFRYFLKYFNEKWFNFRYSDSEYFLVCVFKNMSPVEDPCYNIFMNVILQKIPMNSKNISNFIEILFNSTINSPLQFKFVNDLARKSPLNIPYYSILFFFKNSVNGIFTRISHHYLIPLILDFYNVNELLRLAVWHYICRLVQFCITVQCLKKQQRMMNKDNEKMQSLQQQRPFSLPASNQNLISSSSFTGSGENNINLSKNLYSNSPITSSPISLISCSNNFNNNIPLDEDSSTCSMSEDYSPFSTPPLSSSENLINEAFNGLESYSEVVNDIIDLLHILYALHIPLLCRTIYMEIRCAQISFNFFRKHKFDESYIFLTAEEIHKAQYVELQRETIQEIQKEKNISKSDLAKILQRKKEIYYIQHYLYDKQLIKEFSGIRPREINLRKLLDFPVSGIPLKRGTEKKKPAPSNTKQSTKAQLFACSSLASTLCGIQMNPKSDSAKTKPPSRQQSNNNNENNNQPSPMMRLKQYFSKESTSASAE